MQGDALENSFLQWPDDARHRREELAFHQLWTDGASALNRANLYLPMEFVRDVWIAARKFRMQFTPGQDQVWEYWLREIFDARLVPDRPVADALPITRAVALRAVHSLGKSSPKPLSQSEAVSCARRWIADRCDAKESLEAVVGAGAWRAALYPCTRVPADALYGVIAAIEDNKHQRIWPSIVGTDRDGVSHRVVRGVSAEFLERAPGRVPENPGRLAAIEHSYRILAPELFLERATSSKLLQSFGQRAVVSSLRASLHVTIDLLESMASHRLVAGAPCRPIDTLRGVACCVVAALAAGCEPLRLRAVVRLRRWLPGRPEPREVVECDISRDTHRFALPGDAAVAFSTTAAGFPLDDVPIDGAEEATRGREDTKRVRWDAVGRLALGELRQESASSRGAWPESAFAVGLHLMVGPMGGAECHFELRRGRPEALSQAGRVDLPEILPVNDIAVRLVKELLGVLDGKTHPVSEPDLLGGLR